eukprot:g2237.t1
MDSKKEAVAIKVRSKDPEDEEKKKKSTHQKKKEDVEDEDDGMSEEDRQLKEDLELAVARVEDEKEGVRRLAVETLRSKIRSATSSMTSVPKPLKFLGPHYETLKKSHEGLSAHSETKKQLADVLSVLAMTMASDATRESLSYKLEGCKEDIAAWGHEYVRNLAGEVGEEFAARIEKIETEEEEKGAEDEDADALEKKKTAAVGELVDLVKLIVKFDMCHNAEAEAVDLLMEVQQLPLLLPLTFDARNTERVCAYLLRSALYESDPEERQGVYDVTYQLYLKQGRECDALRVAMRVNNFENVKCLFENVEDEAMRQQMAFILGSHRAFTFQLDEEAFDDAEQINACIGNYNVLSTNYRRLAEALDVVDAKTPDQVYKSKLGDTASISRSADGAHVESATQNAASTFVNAFVNVGYGNDKLISAFDESGRNTWLYKNKARGQLSAAASLGMVIQWDIDEGFSALDKFLYSDDKNIKAGGVLGIGVCNAGIYNTEIDAAIGMLPEYLDEIDGLGKDGNVLLNCSAILALGLSYTGSAREDVLELLTEFLDVDDEDDTKKSSPANDQRATVAALSIGMIYVGTSEYEAAEPIIELLLQSSEAELARPEMRLVVLGLSLLYLGSEEAADVPADILKTLSNENFRKFALMTLKSCAYAGTGNVLKVQDMLHACAEHIDDADACAHQMAAVVGIALVTMGEEVGKNMAMRSMEHLLQYGEIAIRRAVPLAMGLLFVSDPDYSITDLLSKLSHDSDSEVSMNAIFALGLIGAGTNNSRIAGLLRQLSAFHKKKADPLYVVRIAQGLLHMGKGLVTLNPFHSDGLLLSNARLVGVLIVLHSAFNMKQTILGNLHYLLYALAPSIAPRMLVTLDESGEMLPIKVRVGQAVDVVGQAGQPRRITGFQTHTTPVLLAANERAEIVDSEDYEALTTVLEGFVVVREKKRADDDDGDASKMDI